MSNIDRTAVVTGGSSGIGRAVVHSFLEKGYRVAFLGFTKSRVDQVIADTPLENARSRLYGAAVDLRNPGEIEGFFGRVQGKFGNVDVLVNSAGVSPKVNGVRIPTHDLTREQFDDVCRVNLTAPFLCTQQVLPSMMKNRFGRIVMIGSVAARGLPRFAGSAYVAAKAGLAGLTRALVSEYSEFGITFNTVSPGNVASRMTGARDSEQNSKAVARIPLGRIGEPADFGELCVFLASDDAAFITGATIDVTGGEYLFP